MPNWQNWCPEHYNVCRTGKIDVLSTIMYVDHHKNCEVDARLWQGVLLTIYIYIYIAELSKSLSCLSDNRSGKCGQCVRPIKHLPDLHIFYNFNWITHILAISIKWFVYSFKWYLGILKVSTTHFCVTCGNIHTIQ